MQLSNFYNTSNMREAIYIGPLTHSEAIACAKRAAKILQLNQSAADGHYFCSGDGMMTVIQPIDARPESPDFYIRCSHKNAALAFAGRPRAHPSLFDFNRPLPPPKQTNRFFDFLDKIFRF
jgi:hypothetical protein